MLKDNFNKLNFSILSSKNGGSLISASIPTIFLKDFNNSKRIKLVAKWNTRGGGGLSRKASIYLEDMDYKDVASLAVNEDDGRPALEIKNGEMFYVGSMKEGAKTNPPQGEEPKSTQYLNKIKYILIK